LTSAAPGQDPRVSLIVVSYNGADHLRRCIESLLCDPTPSREIVVVDNASTDGSPELLERVQRDHPEIRVVRNAENVGYAGAVNGVLASCRGEYIGVLNMDVVAESGWLQPLLDFLDRHEAAGAAGPMLALSDGQTVNALGQNVHVTALGFNRSLGQPRRSAGDQAERVSGIQGAAFVVRRSILEQTDGMDATGFLYHEDVNLSWLLQMMGLELYCVPTSVVRHDYFLSMHAEKLYLLERNRLALLLAYLEPRTRLRLAPMLLLTEAMLWSYALLKGRRFLAAKARSYIWLWRSRQARAARRQLASGLRRCSDREVLAHMAWGYEWRQFITLASERGAPRKPLGASD
jgi:GT2 family glycosyltransferase